MKVFERGGKINFVDERNVFVGYDFTQQCCENFGWYIADAADASGNELSGIDLAPYRFDISGRSGQLPLWVDVPDKECCAVQFPLIANGKPDLYLVLFNCHNGYYQHGFEMKAANSDIQICRDSL